MTRKASTLASALGPYVRVGRANRVRNELVPVDLLEEIVEFLEGSVRARFAQAAARLEGAGGVTHSAGCDMGEDCTCSLPTE